MWLLICYTWNVVNGSSFTQIWFYGQCKDSFQSKGFGHFSEAPLHFPGYLEYHLLKLLPQGTDNDFMVARVNIPELPDLTKMSHYTTHTHIHTHTQTNAHTYTHTHSDFIITLATKLYCW